MQRAASEGIAFAGWIESVACSSSSVAFRAAENREGLTDRGPALTARSAAMDPASKQQVQLRASDPSSIRLSSAIVAVKSLSWLPTDINGR